MPKRFMKILCVFLCLWISMVTIPSQAQENITIESEVAYVIDLYNHEVVYEKEAEKEMYPASLTKLMTVLVAIENIKDLQTTITMDPEIFEGLAEAQASVAGYQPYDEANLMDLLYGIMLPSGADASRAIAYFVAGSEEAYVDIMNEKAKSLQMNNTHFVNTSGLHDDQHVSTAKDMAMLLEYALQNELFKTIFETDVYTTKSMASQPAGITLYATRLMFLSNADLPDFITGSKTGFTLEAGLCLAATIEEEGMHFILISGNAGDDVERGQHIQDAYTLYSFLQEQYMRVKVFSQGDEVGSMPIQKGVEKAMMVYASKDVYISERYQNQAYSITWKPQDNDAPIEKGQVLGQAIISYDTNEIDRFDVIAGEAMEQSTLFVILSFLTNIPVLLSGTLLCLIGILVFKGIRFYQKRKA